MHSKTFKIRRRNEFFTFENQKLKRAKNIDRIVINKILKNLKTTFFYFNANNINRNLLKTNCKQTIIQIQNNVFKSCVSRFHCLFFQYSKRHSCMSRRKTLRFFMNFANFRQNAKIDFSLIFFHTINIEYS